MKAEPAQLVFPSRALAPIRLSPEAQAQFAAHLLNPPKPADSLVRAVERHRSLIAE